MLLSSTRGFVVWNAIFFRTAFQYLGRRTEIIVSMFLQNIVARLSFPTSYVVTSPTIVTQTSHPISFFLVFELEIFRFLYMYIFSKF